MNITCYMLNTHSSYPYYIELITQWHQTFILLRSTNLCISRITHLKKVTHILIRFNKTKSFLWNKKNTERNRVNDHYIHTPHRETKMTSEWVSVKISDNPPFLEEPLFYRPLPFYGKNMNSFPFLRKFQKLVVFLIPLQLIDC